MDYSPHLPEDLSSILRRLVEMADLAGPSQSGEFWLFGYGLVL